MLKQQSICSVLSFQPHVFKQLLRLKFVNIRTTLTNKFINLAIWVGCTLFVMGYLLQAFGLAGNYGAFQFGGILAAVGLFELYGNAIAVVVDLKNDRTITYYLTLPASACTILLGYVCYYAIIGTLMSFMLIPMAKVMLWNQFSLTAVSWPKLIFFIVLINGLYATATLLLASAVPAIDKLGDLWSRFIFPCWMLGGFQFSWASTYAVVPLVAYVLLLNPVIYVTEGVRAALLGQQGNILWSLCCAILLCIWGIVAVLAFKALKKQLDFV